MSEPLATFETVDGGPGPLVRVVGEVDLTNADALGRYLDAAAAGQRSLTLDLDRAEYLDSHALRVLQRLVDRHVSGTLEVTIVASPDGVAGRLLDLMAVPARVPVVPPTAPE